MKFVKADELEFGGDAPAQLVQRIDLALQGGHFAVHFAHEFVKVQARFAANGHGVEKAVHQKAFAAPHAAIHVNALGNFGVVDELFEPVGTPGLVGGPVISAALQRLHGAKLGGVGLKAARGQFLLVGFGDAGSGHSGAFTFFDG